MAYTNFKPIIWSKKIQFDLPKLTVLQEDCNTTFQGEARMGQTVNIIGATRPTVATYVPGTSIGAAQTQNGTITHLSIDQYKFANFGVDDVDKAQSVPGVMEALMKGAMEELAEARDTYIASLAANATNASASTAVSTADAAKDLVDAAFVSLWGNGVKPSHDVSITLSPWFYSLFKDKLTELYTNNVEMLRRGIIGMYNGAQVKLSNNLYNDGTDDYMLIRTKAAIAFAGGIEKVEAYRPEGQFEDAVKILDTFGAKIVRQPELYVIKAHA